MYWWRKRSATNRGWTERDTLENLAEYASLKPWMEAAILDVMPDAWKMRQEIAELLISKKDAEIGRKRCP